MIEKKLCDLDVRDNEVLLIGSNDVLKLKFQTVEKAQRVCDFLAVIVDFLDNEVEDEE